LQPAASRSNRQSPVDRQCEQAEARVGFHRATRERKENDCEAEDDPGPPSPRPGDLRPRGDSQEEEEGEAEEHVAKSPMVLSQAREEAADREEDAGCLERAAPRMLSLIPRERVMHRPAEIEQEREERRGSGEDSSDRPPPRLRGKRAPTIDRDRGER